MRITVAILISLLLTCPVFADFQVDSFDDISSWSDYPVGVIVQAAAPGDPVVEGSGALLADYTPRDSGDNYYLNKTVSLDLSPVTIGVSEAAISLWMWIGKETLTARLDSLTFETSYQNEFIYDPTPWNYTLSIGWHQIVVAQSDFAITGSPDWSNITNIKIVTTAYNEPNPADLLFDDLRLIEYIPPPTDQIETFDNIAAMHLNVYPQRGWLVQDTQNFIEGTGALVIEYQSNYLQNPTGNENFYVSWNLPAPLVLTPAAINAEAAAINFWVWIGKDIRTSRPIWIKFATQQYSSEFVYEFDWHKTYPVGWNLIVIPQSAFIESSTTTITPDWSSISWIQFHTTCSPDTTPTDFRIDDLRLVEYIPPPPLVPPGVGQIDSFDDISDWSVLPSGMMAQGAAPNDPVKEGTGALIADYTPYSSDTYTFSKDVSLAIDLELAASVNATINLSMWIGKTSQTARIDTLSFETSPGNAYLYDIDSAGTIYPVGWNQLYLPMSDSTTIGSPDWSNITRIELTTTSYPDTTPTDVVFDNLRVIETVSSLPGEIETFDDVSCLNVNPKKDWSGQDNQQYVESTGALKIAYGANYPSDPTDDFQISWYTPAAMDLTPATIGATEASISFWMWVGKTTPTSRVTSIIFASEYNTDYFEFLLPPASYTMGWNQVIISQSDFTATDSPDWSNISWIALNTSSSPDTTPTDLLIDNLRLMENKSNILDLSGDGQNNLIDIAMMGPCWLVDCIANPGDACCAVAPAVPVISQLRCEYQEAPLGIDTIQPRFTWNINSSARGVLQSAYHMLVASSQANLDANIGDMWDSGKVSSDQSIHIPYAGKALQSTHRYYWKARCWDQTGQISDYSDLAWFEMGLLQQDEWTGDWIGGNDLVRKEIFINKTIQQARVFIAGLGYYELRINGAKVGDHVLDPGWTKYDKTVLYATYDVTGHLQVGQNGIGVMLGNGYYSWPQTFAPRRVLLQLNIDFTDGSSTSLVSDGSWKMNDGPIIENHIFDGETYDARNEKTGWDMANYNAIGWNGVQILSNPTEKLVSQMIEPIKVTETITPVSLTNPQPGVFVFDLGQNIAGWARLNVTGPAGTTITLKFGEFLDGSGNVDQTNIISSAEATDVYILKGSGLEVWEPRFTYHGFRYIEMTGYPGVPDVNSLDGRVVHSDLAWTGSFNCSNAMINQIQQNVHWGLRDNFHSLPTSACQRGERGAWGGDSQVMAEAACHNFGMGRFYSKWLNDFKDDQRQDGGVWDVTPWDGWGGYGAPGWHDCYFKIAQIVYQHYGDTRVIEEQMDGMAHALDFILDANPDLIWENRTGGNYADWGSPVSDDEHKALLNTCNLYRATLFMSQMCAAINQPAEAQSYANLADQIATALNARFFNTSTSQYAGGAQAANAFALFLSIIPSGYETAVANNLVNDVVNNNNTHLTTGCQGTRYVPLALTMTGHADVAYGLATQTTQPSWGYMIANGATTLWEFWGGGNQISHNHPFLGSISEWFYEVLAGIDVDPAGPGYKKIIIKPHVVGDLTWVQGSVDTIRGEVVSDWTHGGNSLTFNVTLPGNSTAKVHVPKMGLSNITVTEGGNTIWQSGAYVPGVTGITAGTENNDYVIFDVGSGLYNFVLNGI